ncbi:hypothetical protein ACFWXK_31395 [Streptomyces sp. NPDC059070]|uniref:hypothetical protein n=1 Tax=unclassified Streptomyces TaxID=2593676 RepID=UPI0034E1A20B
MIWLGRPPRASAGRIAYPSAPGPQAAEIGVRGEPGAVFSSGLKWGWLRTSDRTRKAITSLRSTLAVYRRRRVPGAADLARRAHEALA